MIKKLDPAWLPEHNQAELNHYLILQEGSFPADPRYTAEKWDRRADFWEQERKQHRKNDRRVENTLEYLNQRGILKAPSRIADIGCGPGRFAAAFACQGHSVVGFDISSRMVAHGNAHIQSQGLSNVQLRCCDFAALDIGKEGYEKAFDLVFSSLTPAVHNVEGLTKAMKMSRAWCLNISHIRRRNQLQEQILREVFHRSPPDRGAGRAFYALLNILFLLGYQPETSYMTRRKETQVRPEEAYAVHIMERALSAEEQSAENAGKILAWLAAHAGEDGCVTEISDAVYGRLLWDVRIREERPDYGRSL